MAKLQFNSVRKYAIVFLSDEGSVVTYCSSKQQTAEYAYTHKFCFITDAKNNFYKVHKGYPPILQKLI